MDTDDECRAVKMLQTMTMRKTRKRRSFSAVSGYCEESAGVKFL